MPERVLVGHDRDWNNVVLGNQMKAKNCGKDKLKLLVGFTDTEFCFHFRK
jgi:hypothetical protein